MKRCVLSLAMLASLPLVAHAEDVVAYQAEGNAPATSADARVMALDDAFASAVTNALADLVSTEVRTARKGELDREIVRRARLWVAKFSVTKDETNDHRRELAVTVRIDRDKLRARLSELGIATKAGAASGSETTGSEDVGSATGPTATVLLRVLAPDGVRAGWGKSAAENLPGLGAFTKLLRTAGFAVRRAPASGPAASAESVLPLSDEEASALAQEANADVVAIAGVKIGESVPVRGLPTTASLVTASVRMLDRKDHKVLGQSSATAAAKGNELGYAIDRSLVGAAHDVLPKAPAKLGPAGAFAGDDTPLADAGVVLVRLPAKTPLSLVLLEQKYLAGAKGVRAATLRRMSPAGWVIGVTTSQPIEQVARIAKRAPASDTTASVKIVGDVVDVTLRGAR